MNYKLQTSKYLLFDSLAGFFSWILFFAYRKKIIETEKYGYDIPFEYDNKIIIGAIVITAIWLLLHYLSGYYKNIFRRSRLKEFIQTFLISIIGVVIIFFIFIIDDQVSSYKNYYQSVFVLFSLQFFSTWIPRLILSSQTNYKLRKREMGFKTILVGSNENAFKLYTEMESQPKLAGNLFDGFVHIENKNVFSEKLKSNLNHLGEFHELKNLIKERKTEEVIIAIESSEHNKLGEVLNELYDTNVVIKIIPDMYDILSGSVKMNSIFGAPLIEISNEILSEYQKFLKRAFDIFVSLIFLTIFSPVYLILSIGVKLSSKGPILYGQQRIGQHGKPFTIFKFRSMYTDAEKNGPALSSENDPRITPFGRFLRKSRLDELPQFVNVIIGEMSLVGPRPERQFFIDQIVKVAPHYKHLHKVRPGITSWGQVKYGYAENIEQMITRMKFDLIYIENISFLIDLKILIYTILIVIQGRGK